jgi:hypothetical protein
VPSEPEASRLIVPAPTNSAALGAPAIRALVGGPFWNLTSTQPWNRSSVNWLRPHSA